MGTSLLNGCALVIDDEIYEPKSSISKMISTLEAEGTLFVKSKDLPAINARGNLSGISFIILDWDIKSEKQATLPDSVHLGGTFRSTRDNENKTFIIEMLTKYFVPIFIFSQQEKTSINLILQSDTKIAPTLGRRVFVEDKNDLTGKKVKLYLTKWLKGNKTVLTLKMFEEQLNLSKNSFLVELGELTTDWVRVIYQTLSEDYKEKGKPLQTDLINTEFNEFLLNSLLSRLEYADFSKTKYTRIKTGEISKADIDRIYESIKFYKYKTPMNQKQAYEGDLYRKKDNSTDSGFADEFFVNINAPCDLRCKKLLLIKGVLVNKLDKPKIGETKSTYDLCIFMNKAAIQFKFRNIRYYNRPNDLSSIEIQPDIYERIGRITHPYITAIRSEYAHFIARQGIPRHPK